MGVPPLTNNTAKMSSGKDLVKIRPAVALQSRQKKKIERPLKYKTSSPSLAASCMRRLITISNTACGLHDVLRPVYSDTTQPNSTSS